MPCPGEMLVTISRFVTNCSFWRGHRPRRWPVVTAAFTAVASYLVLAAGPAGAQTVINSPNSGPPGTPFTVSWSGYGNCPVGANANYNVYWNYQLPGQILLNGTPVTGISGSLNVSAPNDPPNTYPVTVVCETMVQVFVTASAPFTIPAPPPTTTTTTTLPPVTTTTAPLVTTTTRPRPGTTTTRPTGSTTTSSSTTTTTTKPGTPTTTTTTLPKQTRVLLLSALAIPPAGSETATGHGCNSNGLVLLTVDTKPVGKTTAATDGSYSAPLQVSSLPVGRYQVVAHCGLFVIASDFDVVLATEPNSDTATLLIIVFFLLIGLALFRRRIRLDAPTAAEAPIDEGEGEGVTSL